MKFLPVKVRKTSKKQKNKKTKKKRQQKNNNLNPNDLQLDY